jgi:DNA-binding MarR family transcriptional regulator
MSGLEEKAYIFGTIFTLSNRLQLLGDRIDPQLTVKQWLFLAGVLGCENDAPTLSEISARIGSSRQNVKKMALILEKQGFITMEKDDRDGRMLRISLTDSCKEHLKQREEMELRFIDEIFSGFEAKELSNLSSAIGKLERNVRDMGLKFYEKEL